MLAKIEFEPDYADGAVAAVDAVDFGDPNARNLVAEVSTKEVVMYGADNAGPLILVVDCGCKYNIIRQFVSRGARVKVVPWDHDFSAEEYDGLFISNGPGDPVMADTTVQNLRKVLEASPADDTKPIFGICLGNQLLGLAAGATTYKLPFGNRGQNQPVLNNLTGQCFITPQNHGYALNAEELPEGWAPLFVNRNDGSNEGIMHTSKPWLTAQFHPEAWGGPTDSEFLFDAFVTMMTEQVSVDTLTSFQAAQVSARGAGHVVGLSKPTQATRVHPEKILLLGSGGLSIGQAGEFDYSGNQAIKALKEEGCQVVLMNPNIASVQTNPAAGSHKDSQADVVYFMPVTPAHVEEVIMKERPDGIILSMGGQTALNCGVEMWEAGTIQKHGVAVLGTSIDTVVTTEDRELFKAKVEEVAPGRSAESRAVTNLAGAKATAEEIGYPIMIRSAFALGGLGSGICVDEAQLVTRASSAFTMSPQILVEKSLSGWKEVEYEVVRDAANNCITVCNMENFDPMGVHTGDSMVVAPSQTLSNTEYHMLRDCAIDVVRHLDIVGECNIQYTLDPHSLDFKIIEVNPRLSRSSALASKATGYPLAFMAAKLALGIELPDIRNTVTQTTTACFEPSLDYLVTKVPRWDLGKFDRVSRDIGSAMQSVGEVMAIGRNFEESFQKALRMVEPTACRGFEVHDNVLPDMPEAELDAALASPNDRRIYAFAQALDKGYSVARLHELSKVDPWFLHKLQRIKQVGDLLGESTLRTTPASLMQIAKKAGFSDTQIALRVGAAEMEVRRLRLAQGITPVVKQIDTTAAETPAKTNYLYTSYHGVEHDVEFDEKGVMVLGSGAYRIGSSVEFDWATVSCARTLRRLGYPTVMLNYNPETVSTDYDECDRLYFDELSLERVLDVQDLEQCRSTIVSVGGQIPNGLALDLDEHGVQILGTAPKMIDNAEDRSKFSDMCDRVGIDQPQWAPLTSKEDAFNFADKVGYPVLVRPSYVLSGAAMNVAYSAGELSMCLEATDHIDNDHPVVISEFIEGAREIDIDAVADGGMVIAVAISEHVENAGVHSGDATLVLPTQTIPQDEIVLVKEITAKMAAALEISGPFNMQLIAKEGTVKVIECNLRASRSCPFSSKSVGADFIEKATRVMVGANTPADDDKYGLLVEPKLQLDAPPRPVNYVAVKAPMFSFHRLSGADPSLGVEMSSTGEVGCFGRDKEEAFLKAILSTTFKLPQRKILVSIASELREPCWPTLQKLSIMGYELFATADTAASLRAKGIPVTQLHFAEEGLSPSVDEAIKTRELELVLMFSNQMSVRKEANYQIRRLATDFNVPLITNVQVAEYLIAAIEKQRAGGLLDTKSLQEYWAEDGNM
jgi:carbamoyl-phosphate synthase (ammonia)